MAKKLKFPLVLKDNNQARTLEEIREYWDLEKIMLYYRNGKLLTWLEDRNYEDECMQLRMLCEDSADFIAKLQHIFGVETAKSENIKLSELTEKQKKIEKLRQFTADETVFNSLDQVAFDQEELADALDAEYNTIYLCQNQFRIPLRLHNKHYIGLGRVKVVITAQPSIEFDDYNIIFTNIELVDPAGNPFVTYSLKKAKKLYLSGQTESAIAMFETLVESGDQRAGAILGEIYMYDYSTPNYNRGYSLVERSAKSGDVLGRFFLAENTKKGFDDIYEELFEPLKSEVSSNDPFAAYALASYYEQTGAHRDLSLATEFYHLSAKEGYWRAYRDLGWNYRYGRGVDVDYYKAQEYYLKNATSGDCWSQIQLGELLYHCLEKQEEGLKWYRMGYTPQKMKKKIQELVKKIDNLEDCSPWLLYTPKKVYSGNFSSKQTAIKTYNNWIRQCCNEINQEIFSKDSEVVTKLVSNYTNHIQSILNDIKLYQQICNSPNIINDEDVAYIISAISRSATEIVDNYCIDFYNCTYPVEEQIYDSETLFASDRYYASFSFHEVFDDRHGLDYFKNGKEYCEKVRNILRELLQPFKSELLKINTEVLA